MKSGTNYIHFWCTFSNRKLFDKIANFPNVITSMRTNEAYVRVISVNASRTVHVRSKTSRNEGQNLLIFSTLRRHLENLTTTMHRNRRPHTTWPEPVIYRKRIPISRYLLYYIIYLHSSLFRTQTITLGFVLQSVVISYVTLLSIRNSRV